MLRISALPSSKDPKSRLVKPIKKIIVKKIKEPHSYLDTAIFVSVCSIILLMVLPFFPIILPMRLLCARIFKGISLQKDGSTAFRERDFTVLNEREKKNHLPSICGVRLLLHYFHYFLASCGATFWCPINSYDLKKKKFFH